MEWATNQALDNDDGLVICSLSIHRLPAGREKGALRIKEVQCAEFTLSERFLRCFQGRARTRRDLCLHDQHFVVRRIEGLIRNGQSGLYSNLGGVVQRLGLSAPDPRSQNPALVAIKDRKRH